VAPAREVLSCNVVVYDTPRCSAVIERIRHINI
jgi:hypothetical protein